MKVLVLGASGSVGRRVVDEAAARGYAITAQTRDSSRLQSLAGGVRAAVFEPRNPAALATWVPGHNAVVFALGESATGPTTLFSDVTRALLPVAEAAGVQRLVVVTGVGAGETLGHGGLIYDHLIFPLFTRHLYADKERQEAMVRASALEWVIVRPARFVRRVPPTPMQVIEHVLPNTRLTGVRREEVAAFILDQLGETPWLRRSVFIGHA